VVVGASRQHIRVVARTSVKMDEHGRLAMLGEGIKAMRMAEGLSQEALADTAGIDRSHMSRIERGKRNVSFLNICRIADALGRKPSDLLTAGNL